MTTSTSQFKKAIDAFDSYNQNDPNKEESDGKMYSKEILYAERMTAKLNQYAADAPEYVQLAARCQHIGRWEIARDHFAMDKKGYLQWRNQEKTHHAKIAEEILTSCDYDSVVIDKVKFLLLKKELFTNADTQLLEDVICLVFIEHYLEAFAAKHEDEKVVDIIKKTLKKMSPKAIDAALKIPVSEKMAQLIKQAATV
ncbi:MAG TPA: DUF4202 domain-containing protein [Chryseolinea sp.]|nr:DUF4202 domain-containing protein [Chryseolinea sp.]HPH46282.1 DUF4202 domain-containing protein [Chryseolinea sp.]HPM29127.1 DUF4202 domain-containing protein [Chryseolinea sp.]